MAALRRFFPVVQNLRLGVAVSGGPDSVALLGTLFELARRCDLRLTVLHVNHALRVESDQEQTLVETLCRYWQAPCVVERLTPPLHRKGIEAWARTERYRFFLHAKEQYGLAAVALAHTSDDQAETVLFRLLRGAGHRGLAGIPRQREGWIIRPLLDCSRKEVLDYLRVKQLPYVIDSSNFDPRYTRNKIRHELLPLLERDFSPRIRRHLFHCAEALRQEEEWLELQAAAACERVRQGESGLSLARLKNEPEALHPRLFRLWLERSGDIGELNFPQLRKLYALGQGHLAGEVELPGAYSVRREGEFLVKVLKRTQLVDRPYCYAVTPGMSFVIPESGWQVQASHVSPWRGSFPDARSLDQYHAIFDHEALSESLTIRTCLPGDRIRPLGMRGHRKVHDIFIDRKIAPRQRKLWPLVLSGAEIIWIPGCVRGEHAKVSDATRRVLRLTINPLPEK